MRNRLLGIMIFVLLLCGCGVETSQGTPSLSTPSTPSETKKPSGSNNETAKKDNVFNKGGVIQEQVLYDNNDVLIKATELSYEENRAKLVVNAENNSNHDIQILSGTMGFSCNAVNGWMAHDGWINMEVPAGKKANDRAYYDYSPLISCGIHGINTLYVTLQIEFDGNYSNKITTAPIEIKTALTETNDEDRTFDNIATDLLNRYSNNSLQFYSDEEVFNSAGIRVPAAAYLTSSNGDKHLVLELINESDQVLDVDSSNISANGFSLCNGRWSSEAILPGKKTYMSLELTLMKDEDDWKAMGITDVSDIVLDLGVRNLDYDYISQPQTITFHVTDVETSVESSGEELYSANNIRIVSKGITNPE